jgi:putative ABC transport system permease protein
MSDQHGDADDLWRRMRRVFRLPFSRTRLDAEVDEELRFHLEGRVQELMEREGLARDAAEREARRRFGDFARYRREARDIDHDTHRRRNRMELRDAIGREIRHAARTLVRTPSFSLITFVTLALSIGAAAAIFTLLDAVVLRPLPYPNADRLVQLSSPVPKLKGQSRWGLGRHEMFYFLAEGRTFDNLGVYQLSDVTVLGASAERRAERVRMVQSSASLLQVLGFTPEHGRLLVADDNRERRPLVVVLGHDYWSRRFGGDRSVIGRPISLEGYPLTIVGVLPRGAQLPEDQVDLWIPAWVDSTVKFNNHTWNAIGRLRPGVTAADAQRDLAPLTERLPERFPEVYNNPDWVKNTGFSTEVVPLRDAVVGERVTRALWTLFAAVGLVLLIAAANVANLFLVRLDARAREIALRTALGADRGHLAWHYLSESLLLAGAAAIAAVGIAQAMLRALLAVAPSDLPRLADVHLGVPGVAFALGVGLLAGLLFGALPLVGARFDLALLREGGRGLTTSRRRMAARRVLVASQMAFAVVLLAGAVLMVQTFRNLRAIDVGFEPRGVLTLTIALPNSRYGNQADRASDLFTQLASRLRELPGTQRVGFSDRMPLLSGDWCTGITLEGPTPGSASGACPPTALVSPGYFEAMGISVSGQAMTWDGMNKHDGGMVVSRAFADHWWPNENPIGKGLRFSGRQPPFYRVVGVAEDIRGAGIEAPPPELVYFPMRPIPGAPLWASPTHMNLVLKTSSPNPMALTATIARVLQELEPDAAIANAATMESIFARAIARQSFTMVLLALSATIAIILSAVGIYGVISYIVTQRRGEIGVRMALGAPGSRVAFMVLRQSLGLAVLGVAAGVVGAVAVTRLLSALLYGVQPTDPLTLTLVPLALLAVAVMASYAPARRASRVDPVEALRGD